MIMIVLILLFMTLVPIEIARIARMLDSRNRYLGVRYRHSNKHPHVVIVGNVEFTTMVPFIMEVSFLHII